MIIARHRRFSRFDTRVVLDATCSGGLRDTLDTEVSEFDFVHLEEKILEEEFVTEDVRDIASEARFSGRGTEARLLVAVTTVDDGKRRDVGKECLLSKTWEVSIGYAVVGEDGGCLLSERRVEAEEEASGRAIVPSGFSRRSASAKSVYPRNVFLLKSAERLVDE